MCLWDHKQAKTYLWPVFSSVRPATQRPALILCCFACAVDSSLPNGKHSSNNGYVVKRLQETGKGQNKSHLTSKGWDPISHLGIGNDAGSQAWAGETWHNSEMSRQWRQESGHFQCHICTFLSVNVDRKKKSPVKVFRYKENVKKYAMVFRFIIIINVSKHRWKTSSKNHW